VHWQIGEELSAALDLVEPQVLLQEVRHPINAARRGVDMAEDFKILSSLAWLTCQPRQ
jgi:hypothetical protein